MALCSWQILPCKIVCFIERKLLRIWSGHESRSLIQLTRESKSRLCRGREEHFRYCQDYGSGGKKTSRATVNKWVCWLHSLQRWSSKILSASHSASKLGSSLSNFLKLHLSWHCTSKLRSSLCCYAWLVRSMECPCLACLSVFSPRNWWLSPDSNGSFTLLQLLSLPVCCLGLPEHAWHSLDEPALVLGLQPFDCNFILFLSYSIFSHFNSIWYD